MKLINIYSLFFEADQVGKPMQKFLFTSLSNLWNLLNHCIYDNFQKKTFKFQHFSINFKFQLILNMYCQKSFPVLYYMRNNNNLEYHFPAYKKVSHILSYWICLAILTSWYLWLYITNGKTREMKWLAQ